MITVTFQDQPDGTVKVVCIPPANEIFAKMKGGHKMSNAESMAAMALLRVMAESMKADQESRSIFLPISGEA